MSSNPVQQGATDCPNLISSSYVLPTRYKAYPTTANHRTHHNPPAPCSHNPPIPNLHSSKRSSHRSVLDLNAYCSTLAADPETAFTGDLSADHGERGRVYRVLSDVVLEPATWEVVRRVVIGLWGFCYASRRMMRVGAGVGGYKPVVGSADVGNQRPAFGIFLSFPSSPRDTHKVRDRSKETSHDLARHAFLIVCPHCGIY